MNTVFIADDNATDRIILESGLRKLGYEVVSFSCGTDIHTAICNAGKPVIALLDWMMPDRNGVDICNELSTDPPSSPVYAIIITSHTEKSDIAYALDNGSDDFIAKPFDMTELRARINVGIRLLDYRQQLFDSNEEMLRNLSRQVNSGADTATLSSNLRGAVGQFEGISKELRTKIMEVRKVEARVLLQKTTQKVVCKTVEGSILDNVLFDGAAISGAGHVSLIVNVEKLLGG